MRELRHQPSGGGGFTRTLTPLADSNRLHTVQIGGVTHRYQYDSAGNLVQEDTTRAFEWDHANRMRAFRDGPAGATPTIFAQYRYDSAGQRIMKVLGQLD